MSKPSVHLWNAKEQLNFCGVVSFTEQSSTDPRVASHEACFRAACNGGVILPMPQRLLKMGLEELRVKLARVRAWQAAQKVGEKK